MGINAHMETGKDVLRNWYNSTFSSETEVNDIGGVAMKEGALWLLRYVEQLDFGNETLHATIIRGLGVSSQDITTTAYTSNTISYSGHNLKLVLGSIGQTFAKFGFTAIFSVLSALFFLIEHSLTQIISIVTFLATSFYILQSDKDILLPLVQIIPEQRIAQDFEVKFRKYGMYFTALC